ncbi:MAG TPA: cytochrome C oxidase subunit I [Bacteroidia bacterium]
MIVANNNGSLTKNTSYKVVLPFYTFAALSFLAATLLLFTSTLGFTQHYFHPQTLAITHLMALGWSTMMILGAGHQLVPVLIEGKLFSNALAYLSFSLAAIGIPLLVYAFYIFKMGFPAQCGAILVNAAIVSYLVNLTISIAKSKKENIHAVFVFTATVWLLLTTLVGLLLVYNFTLNILSKNSQYYLSLHAHMGIIGWFLLLVIGIGSRLIPLFLISKYNNTKLLWAIYFLINTGLLSFVFIFLYSNQTSFYFLPITAIVTTLILFGYYCSQSYRKRIRKQVDDQIKISLLSVLMMAVPVIILLGMIATLLVSGQNTKLVLLYGFSLFFGWITAIILGMTFKTLPFIVWNKVYHHKAGLGKTPNPKDLFSSKLFTGTYIAYLIGFILFAAGILISNTFVLKSGTVFLLLTATLYNWNVFKILTHKSKI